jgi:hypothetical protein
MSEACLKMSCEGCTQIPSMWTCGRCTREKGKARDMYQAKPPAPDGA